ncbi:MAG: family 43 glycosylhydrolase [Prolixibacteraceae bacterium]|jgi:xylan 1,4-beta-xylosidase|nr:family 43 glycosylhydrolase [Prolixibacteraceae bacterium]
MKYFFPLLFFFLSVSNANGRTKDSLSTTLDSYIEERFPLMPVADVLIRQNIQDIHIMRGPSKTYYLTGTSGDVEGVQEGIKVWASNDFKKWNLIGTNSDYIWTFEDDAVDWQKEVTEIGGRKKRGIIAPEIHFINDTYFLTYTNSNSGYGGILKSLSGRPQGPYEEISGEEPLMKATGVTLFENTDGTVYFIWGNGKVHRMKADMSGFASESFRAFTDTYGNTLDVEGINVQLIDGVYYLSGSRETGKPGNDECLSHKRYDGVVYKSSDFLDPYKKVLSAIPHGGGGHLFRTFDDSLNYVMANNTSTCPVGAYPGVLQLTKFSDKLLIKDSKISNRKKKQQVVYVSRIGNNSSGDSWDNAFTTIQKAINNATYGAQIWVATGYYYEPVVINLWKDLSIYGGFSGWEKSLSERDIDMNRVILNGRQRVSNMLVIKVSKQIRIDGITIKGGDAYGKSDFGRYGAGVHVLGGGETVKFVNCRFEDNKAARDGGAVYASLGASPVFINCDFSGNIALNNGGAVAFYANSPNGYTGRFYNCTFHNNQSQMDGSAVYFDSNIRGKGLLTMVNCLFEKNQTFGHGGTVKADGYANVFIQNSTFSFNKGIQSGAACIGAAAVPGKMNIINSIFYQNEGGTLFSIEGEAETVLDNDKLYYRNVWVNISNCLFNEDDAVSIVERRFDRKVIDDVETLNNSVIGKACISDNPGFVDALQGDFRLKSNSAARYKGSSSCFFLYDMNMQKRRKGRINLGAF